MRFLLFPYPVDLTSAKLQEVLFFSVCINIIYNIIIIICFNIIFIININNISYIRTHKRH